MAVPTQESALDDFDVARLSDVASAQDIDAIRARFVLLLPRGAAADEIGVAAAVEQLAQDESLGAVVELSGDAGAGPLLEAVVGAMTPGAMLVRADVLRLFSDAADSLTLAFRVALLVRIALSFEIALAAHPLGAGGEVEALDPDLRGGLARDLFGGFALEDIASGAREASGTLHGLAQLGMSLATRLLGADCLREGFEIGAYATRLADAADPGEGTRLRGTGRLARCRQPYPAPLATIVVVTHDRPILLRRALQSLVEQAFDDFEVVLVNDAGPEPLGLEVFRSQIAGGGRLSVVSHDRNRGLAAARNTGIRLARGRYVGFLDDDDRLLPGHLAALLPRLLLGARVVHADCRRVTEVIDPDGSARTVEAAGLYRSDYEPVHFQLDNQFPVHSILLERELVLQAGGFDESLPVLEDWDLWRRVFLLSPPVHVRRVTSEVRARKDGTNMTARNESRWLEVMARIYEKSLDTERLEPQVRSARVRHLLSNCHDRGLPFPRGAAEWLAGGGELLPIDPDRPAAYFDQLVAKPDASE